LRKLLGTQSESSKHKAIRLKAKVL
jgi:hypothetical protein